MKENEKTFTDFPALPPFQTGEVIRKNREEDKEFIEQMHSMLERMRRLGLQDDWFFWLCVYPKEMVQKSPLKFNREYDDKKFRRYIQDCVPFIMKEAARLMHGKWKMDELMEQGIALERANMKQYAEEAEKDELGKACRDAYREQKRMHKKEMLFGDLPVTLNREKVMQESDELSATVRLSINKYDKLKQEYILKNGESPYIWDIEEEFKEWAKRYFGDKIPASEYYNL